MLGAAAMSFAAFAEPMPMLYGFMPSTGSPKMLVLLCQTPDHPPRLSPEQMREKLSSRKDDDFTSLAEYYDKVSHGRLRLSIEVTDWITVPNPMDFYAAGNHGRKLTGWPRNVGGFAYHAVYAALRSGMDFSRFDNDGDGHVDGLMVVFSGPGGFGGGDKNRLWSRYDYISYYGQDPVSSGRLLIDRFALCPEYFSNDSPYDVRVYAHETGHLLGLPDLVDQDASTFGIGAYGLMGYPVPGESGRPLLAPTAFSREYLGWLNPMRVRNNSEATLRPVMEHPEAIRLETGREGEYFLLEYRVNEGIEERLFGRGVLLWHVNQGALYGNDYETNRRNDLAPLAALVQADGRNDLERKSNKGDAWDFLGGAGGITEAGANTGSPTNPTSGAHTLAFDGRPAGIRVDSVRITEDKATMNIVTDDALVYRTGEFWPVFTGASWVEVKGNGDGFAQRGERLAMKMKVWNAGGEGKGLKFEIEEVKGLKWKKTSDKVKGLAPGEAGEVEFELVVPDAKPKGMAALASAWTDAPEQPGAAGDTISGPLGPVTGVMADHEAYWFAPKVTMTSRKPKAQTSFEPRLLMGAPPLMIVCDGPRDLHAYLSAMAEHMSIPYLLVDVARQGLPAKAAMEAPPMVLWVSGASAIEGHTYPGKKRLELMKAVPDAGHVLVWSASRMKGLPSMEVLGLMGAPRVRQLPGARVLRGIQTDPESKGLRFIIRSPYEPAITPHLWISPEGGARPFLTDEQQRPVAAISKNEKGGKVVTVGFPVEALYYRNIGKLLQWISAKTAD